MFEIWRRNSDPFPSKIKIWYLDKSWGWSEPDADLVLNWNHRVGLFLLLLKQKDCKIKKKANLQTTLEEPLDKICYQDSTKPKHKIKLQATHRDHFIWSSSSNIILHHNSNSVTSKGLFMLNVKYGSGRSLLSFISSVFLRVSIKLTDTDQTVQYHQKPLGAVLLLSPDT